MALLNIVNNIEGIDLGEHLQSFKDFTKDFTPALRGDGINNFEFVKRIHNSFARYVPGSPIHLQLDAVVLLGNSKMDMLNSDLHLKNEAGSKRSKSAKNGYYSDDSDSGFHFIAFVPVEGKVWKFDGLERQPQDLGMYSDHVTNFNC